MKNKFTLIELIIVIVVIGILAAMALPKVTSIVKDARISAMINDKETLEKTILLYYQKYDELPLLNEDQEFIVLNDNISLTRLVNAKEVDDMTTIYTSLQETLKHYNDSEESLYRIDISKVKENLSRGLKYGTKKSDKDFYVYSTKTSNVYYYKPMLNGEGEIYHNEFNTGLKISELKTREYNKENAPIPIVTTMNNKISLGFGHTVKVSEDGNVFSWGNNNYGQLGLGNTNNYSTPQKIDFFEDKEIEFVFSGFYHSMALSKDGILYSWGENNCGQLGVGNTTAQKKPQKVSIPNDEKVVFVSLGYEYSMIITEESNLYSFGRNDYGQLGLGNNVNQTTPQLVNFNNEVKAISVSLGSYHAIAICNDENLYGWGDNEDGQLGIGTNTNKNIPTMIPLPENIKPLNAMAGQDHTTLLGDNGDIYSFGRSTYGELGLSSVYKVNIPTKILFENKFKDIYICGHNCYALSKDNNFYSWGLNVDGQLGIGNLKNQSFLNKVDFFENNELSNVYVGKHGLIVQLKNKEYYAWGNNDFGQLGINANIKDQLVPIKIELP